MTDLAPRDETPLVATQLAMMEREGPDLDEIEREMDNHVRELDLVSTRLTTYRIKEVVTRVEHDCKVCGATMPPGCPMIAETLGRRAYKTTWYYCPFCPAPQPDAPVEERVMRARITDAATREIEKREGESVAALVAQWLDSRTESTRKAYAGDLARFAAWLGVETVAEASAVLLGNGAAAGNSLALRWVVEMRDVEELSSSTINRRLSALRSLSKLAARLERVAWILDVDSVKHEEKNDNRGPTREDVLAKLGSHDNLRDVAMLRLMVDAALRRGEVAGLQVGDVSEDGREIVLVKSKGKREPVRVRLAQETADVLLAWLRERGNKRGSVFGLVAGSVYRICRLVLGVRPHALRHCAITTGLDRTNGNVRAVAAFARHANVKTTMVYDDRRQDAAAEVARAVVSDE